jgi:hypothetical protein
MGPDLKALVQSVRECLGTRRGITSRNSVVSAAMNDEVKLMVNGRKRSVKIIKHGTSNKVLVSQAAMRQRDEQAREMDSLIRGISGWVTEFKARVRPDPKSRFQALFKEA